MTLKNRKRCLLTVETIDNFDYGTLIKITEVGGKQRTIQPPIKPYFYSKKPHQNGKIVKRTFLSDLKEHDVYKVEFYSQRDLEKARNQHSLEANLPFKMRLAIDVGYRFPSAFPKVLAWDCETKLAGLNPDPNRDQIISIATWSEKEEERRFFYGDTKKVITEFLEFWRKVNADVPTEFYGRFYDYIVLLNNCHQYGIKCALGRDGTEPFVLKKEFEKLGKGKTENTIYIKGRVAFDVHKEVESDYTLTLAGFKTRGLKETGRHYKLQPVEIDYEKMDKLSFDELKDYNLSDARVTYEISLIYLRTLYEIAEFLDIPLEMVVQRAPSHIANILIGRGFAKKGIISDGVNCERFPQFFKVGEKAIQGAEPRCFRSGVFLENVKHKDFNSMYVNINRALNLSPETVQLIEIKEYTGKYRFDYQKENQRCIVEVPDNHIGQVVVSIDLSQKGVMVEALDEIVKHRIEAKKLWRETKNPKYDSKQIGLKLIGNIFFGYNTMPYAIYGNVLIGMLDTAIPRLLINASMKQEEDAGNILLEVDTDGYWYIENKATQFNPASVLPSCFNLDLIKQEKEDADGMIILKDKYGQPAAKSYILKDAEGKISKHGSSVLGRHIPLIVDAFVDELAEALFNKQNYEDVLRSWTRKKILGYPLKAFISTAKITKNPDDYESSSIYAELVTQLRKNGINVEWGNTISYVKTIRGYTPSILLNDTSTIETQYYQSRMCDVASRILGIPFKDLKSYFEGNTKLELFL
ncbi:MAG: hypothetical protein NWE98_02030 [Candidatus Bathyarchaeota archaeon]|nr:hypothetical protein [Candidatus Bathyarchaeota archaeon]